MLPENLRKPHVLAPDSGGTSAVRCSNHKHPRQTTEVAERDVTLSNPMLLKRLRPALTYKQTGIWNSLKIQRSKKISLTDAAPEVLRRCGSAEDTGVQMQGTGGDPLQWSFHSNEETL